MFNMQFLCIDSFYFLCIVITCGEQMFPESAKVWFILKDAFQICSFFNIRMPQIRMLQPGALDL